jgi:nicotinamidase-related amidase
MAILNAAETAVVLIDVQERLLPAIHGSDRLLERCGVLVRVARALALPLVVTEQYPRGLGPTAAALREELSGAPVLEKVSFNALADETIARHLRNLGRRTLVMAGVEAHICVLQTTLAALEEGYTVHVVREAVSSRRDEDAEVAVERIRQAGAVVTTLESVAFECLGSARSAAFKAVSGIIR